MSPKAILVEPQEATVDDLTLSVSDEQNSTGYDLSDDQVKRLKAVDGVKLRVEGEKDGEVQDPIDLLTKRELDRALASAQVVVEGDDPSDDDKRNALKEHRAAQEGGDK